MTTNKRMVITCEYIVAWLVSSPTCIPWHKIMS